MRVDFPSYYQESVDSAYPFASDATRRNGDVVIDDDVFVDGRLFPPDGRHDLFLASVEIGETVTLRISDGDGPVGFGEFSRGAPPDVLHFHTDDGAYLGLLQSYPGDAVQIADGGSADGGRGLSRLAGWPDGTYQFSSSQTRFSASVVVPQPQVGVRDVVVGTDVFSDEVVLVGEKGVQLTVPDSGSSSLPGADEQIRVDVVGDPLFVRRNCEESGLEYVGGPFLRALVFDGNEIVAGPGGGVTITVGADPPGARPALRVLPTTSGVKIEFAGG